MNLYFLARRLATVSLALTFVVIVAGSIVRMTGSGMGCPDWPKCFGYYIPPTDVSTLTYVGGRTYGEGQMVLHHDTLWVAQSALTAGEEFNRIKWHKYPKHDYAIFNVWHTWIEYINRLATVVYGIPLLLLAAVSVLIFFRHKEAKLMMLSFGALFMVGFEAWLGKLVVDGNLIEHSITYHMLGSLALVVLLSIMVFRMRAHHEHYNAISRRLKMVIFSLIVLIFIQIILGTQVREQVDILAKTAMERDAWIEMLPSIFLVHRSFSILLVIVVIVIYRSIQYMVVPVQLKLTLVALGLEILAGIVLAYLGMPALAQPVHLLLGVLSFALALYGWMRIQFTTSS
jgi:cytochrome c oxidase assembly protein subunit 15